MRRDGNDGEDGNDGDNWVGMDVPPRGFSAASAAGENTHDATSSTSSKEEFQRLRTAYEVMMEVIGTSTGSAGGRVDVDADMGDILMRALRGEDVREVLAKRGGWRPGNGFGVDYGVVWGGRRVDGVDEEGEEGDGWREALERGLEVDGDTDIETDGSA